MLTVDVLERFPEARERWAKAFRYVLVDEYQDTNHAQYRLLQLLAGEHRNVMRGRRSGPVDLRLPRRGHPQHPRVRARLPRHADRSRSSRTTARRTRSSRAANAVIAHNRERKEKSLWSELGEGEPVRVSRSRTSTPRRGSSPPRSPRSSRRATRGTEIAVFYRTNAQSRVLEDVLVRQGVDYQVIGGPRFYERAEIKDAIAYLQVLDNPSDAVSLLRIANRPRRGIGDTSLARLQTFADAHGDLALGGARPRRGGRARGGVAARGAVASQTLLAVADVGRAGAARRRARRARARAQRLPRGARGRADDRGARPDREPRGARRRRARVRHERGRPSRRSRSSSRRSRSTPTRTRCAASSGARHADDAPQREGARVPRRLHASAWRRGSSRTRARSRSNGIEEERRLCYVGMTRAKERLTLTHAIGALALRARATTTCRRASSTSCRRTASSASGCGRRRGRATARRRAAQVAPRERRARRSRPATRCGTTTLGEGIVTRIEPGGVVTVRFAEDGSERRLMLEYAPLEKIA